MAHALPVDTPLSPDAHLADLVARSARGDEAAFGRLYDCTAHRVLGLAIQVLRDRALAEEATLEAFTQAWRQSPSYDPLRGSVPSWLLTIARSRALDLRRARLRQIDREDVLERAPDLPDPSPDPEAAAAHAQQARRVREALGRLPAEQRELIEAAYFRGLSHSELAAAFAQPLGTVKTRIRNGMERLREALQRPSEKDPR